MEDLRVVLENCLSASAKSSRFDPALFFADWFRHYGAQYYFVFKKNLRATNIQFAELIALLRTHALYKASGSRPDLQFLTPREFTSYIADIYTAFQNESVSERHSVIVDLYLPVLADLATMHVFFGSCALYLPPSLDIDLASVCAESGYIHSCGRLVYVRNATKISEQRFAEELSRYIERWPPNGKKLFFTAYSDEDFSPYDRDEASDLRDGLDDLKVFVEKSYLGKTRLVRFIRELREQFADRLEVAGAGDYRVQRQVFASSPGADTARTIWLLMDHSVGQLPRERGDDVFFVCYDQLYKNENPYHIFDEDKPAWIDHTTIPHTLLGAMLNVTRPWTKRVTIVDPFCGSGTSWLETLKFADAVPACSDLEPLCALVGADNLEFFTGESSAVSRMADSLADLAKHTGRRSPKGFPTASDGAVPAAYDWVTEFFDGLDLAQRAGDRYLEDAQVSALKSRGDLERIIFYIFLRTARRNANAFERLSTEWDKAFLRETKALVLKMVRLALLKNQQTAVVPTAGHVLTYQSTYSLGCTIAPHIVAANLTSSNDASSVKVLNALHLPEESCDVIITDPPYGVNAMMGEVTLARLYSDVMNVMIRALRNDGQLVFAVPDWSHVGHQLPFFIRKEFLIHQVVASARRQGKEVVESASQEPTRGGILRVPYYWESGKALRRAILHFRLRGTQPPQQNT